MTFDSFMRSEAAAVERRLEDYLKPSAGEPPIINRAMRYMVLGGGKRIRPVMCILAFKAGGGKGKTVYPVACAIELIHTFSLIHDDLPCMDDDDYRRGRLTCHKKFGEAVAVLAGDALVTRAFEMLAISASNGRARASTITRMTAELAASIGTGGMIGGQIMDLVSEGKKVPMSTVRYIHSRKTGCLITASLRFGGALAGANPRLGWPFRWRMTFSERRRLWSSLERDPGPTRERRRPRIRVWPGWRSPEASWPGLWPAP
jgi:geranylgeranyl diphosphate synthase type II